MTRPDPNLCTINLRRRCNGCQRCVTDETTDPEPEVDEDAEYERERDLR